MLKEKLMEDLKNSMKNKDEIRKNTVQMVRAAILQIEKDKGIQVEDDKILEIIAKEVKSKKDALKDFEKANREDLIKQTNTEIAIAKSKLVPITSSMVKALLVPKSIIIVIEFTNIL